MYFIDFYFPVRWAEIPRAGEPSVLIAGSTTKDRRSARRAHLLKELRERLNNNKKKKQEARSRGFDLKSCHAVRSAVYKDCVDPAFP